MVTRSKHNSKKKFYCFLNEKKFQLFEEIQAFKKLAAKILKIDRIAI